MSRVLFVCHGNVQRSQMAQGYYNHFSHSQDASSAGVDPYTPQKYSAPHPEAIELMKAQGVDITNQTVKMITPEMVDQASHIYLMTDKDVPEYLYSSLKMTYWPIEDPFLQPISVVKKVQQQVKEHVLSLLK